MASAFELRKKTNKQPSRELQNLTNNDNKILGPNISKKLNKTVPAKKFHSSNFKTQNSAWTPIVNKPSNEQIFNDRRQLVSNWFDMWTDAQRKRFLATIYAQCNRSQLIYTQKWFGQHVPLKHLDFTRVLPRHLSLYIMSFLDPRSLSRASMVSWHWNFLADQDALWMPKSTKLGWYLPYTPSDNEYGAWKRHYVACIQTLDMNIPCKNTSPLYGTISDGSSKQKKIKRKGLPDEDSTLLMSTRPDWLPPDHTPRDLEKSFKALIADYNPNDPDVHKSLTLVHDRFGIPKNKLTFYRNTRESPADYGLQSVQRKTFHRNLTDGDLDLRHSFPMSLSEAVKLESFEEKRLLDLVAQPWEPPPPEKYPVNKSADLSGGFNYPTPWKHRTKQPISKSFPGEKVPRVIFISSRIPAADILVDAVNFGVIPLVYEYEGTTLESLMERLTSSLQGRSAKSVGFFTHSEPPFEDLQLVHGATVNVDNLDSPEFVHFFETISNCVDSHGGHVDIFSPVGSSESGLEMLKQLNVLTGVKFISPTGLIGQYNHVHSEWLHCDENQAPPEHYFCTTKLNVWSNTADQAQEACVVTKKIMAQYFQQVHKEVLSQLTGQIVFDALGQSNIKGINEVTQSLIDGLLSLGCQKNVMPLEYLGRFLLQKSGRNDVQFSLTKPKKKKVPTATLR